jgi:hypothetical protein
VAEAAATAECLAVELAIQAEQHRLGMSTQQTAAVAARWALAAAAEATERADAAERACNPEPAPEAPRPQENDLGRVAPQLSRPIDVRDTDISDPRNSAHGRAAAGPTVRRVRPSTQADTPAPTRPRYLSRSPADCVDRGGPQLPSGWHSAQSSPKRASGPSSCGASVSAASSARARGLGKAMDPALGQGA